MPDRDRYELARSRVLMTSPSLPTEDPAVKPRPTPLQLAHPTHQLAIVAHDGRKPDLRLWVDRHAQLLENVAIVATSTTATVVRAALSEQGAAADRIEAVQSGPFGGDQQIGARIADGRIIALIFLVDPLVARPHEADVQALLRIAQLAEIPTATNVATAELIARSFAWEPQEHQVEPSCSADSNPAFQPQLRRVEWGERRQRSGAHA